MNDYEEMLKQKAQTINHINHPNNPLQAELLQKLEEELHFRGIDKKWVSVNDAVKLELEHRKQWLQNKHAEHLKKTSVIDHFEIIDELLAEITVCEKDIKEDSSK